MIYPPVKGVAEVRIEVAETEILAGLDRLMAPEKVDPSLMVGATVATRVPIGEDLGTIGLGDGETTISIGTGPETGPVDGFSWFPAQRYQVPSVRRKKSCPEA